MLMEAEKITSGKAFILRWAEPRKPNGIISTYKIYEGGINSPIYQGLNRGFEVRYLTPFTVYQFQLEACNIAGCTKAIIQKFTTSEILPSEQSAPNFGDVNSTSVVILWSRPLNPNGEISKYEVIRKSSIRRKKREISDGSIMLREKPAISDDPVIIQEKQEISDGSVIVREKREISDGSVIYSTTDTNYTNYQYVDTDLEPYMQYQYKIRTHTQSPVVNRRPSPDTPTGMDAPMLTVLSSKSIEVSWLPPVRPNGVIIAYDVKRDGTLIYTENAESGEELVTTYVDYDLNAGQIYSYTVIARNQIASVESYVTSAKTYASSPSGMPAPIAQALTATSVVVSWRPPVNPSGSILNYTIYSSNRIVYSGGADVLSYIVVGLDVYTEYMYRVQACTKQGCVLSSLVSIRTLEAPPDGLNPPSLISLADGLGKHIGVLVEWTLPSRPGGKILSYEIRRRQLQPTNDDAAPSYLILCLAEPLQTYVEELEVSTSSTSITFHIEKPDILNGIIQRYSIIIDNVERGTPSLEQIHTVSRLLPNTDYNAQSKACTNGGCTTSSSVTVTTLATVPTGLEPPNIVSVTSTSITLSWSYSRISTVNINRFLLYHRETCPPTEQPFQQICVIGDDKIESYNGIELQHTIINLKPYTAYSFLLEAENGAGMSNSNQWKRVVTSPDEPVYLKKQQVEVDENGFATDWKDSFQLNGMLIESTVVVEEKSVYTGTSFQYYVHTTSYVKNQLVMWILIQTNGGKLKTSNIVVNITNNINEEPSTEDPGSVGKQAGDETDSILKEVWVIVLFCLLALILIIILIAVRLRCCNSQQRYIREKLPLSLKSRNSGKPFTLDVPINNTISRVPRALSNKSVVYPPYSHTSTISRTSLKKYSSSSSEDSGAFNDLADLDMYSYNRGQLTISETLSRSSWDANPDSGLFDDDHDDDSFDAGPDFSLSKERMIFTDTHV